MPEETEDDNDFPGLVGVKIHEVTMTFKNKEVPEGHDPTHYTPEGVYSLIRENLMTQKGYSPYCGSDKCFYGMPRTAFNGEQFACTCGWRSQFEEKFIKTYKKHWGIK